MPIHVVGICGSPIQDSNTEHFLREALKAAEEAGATTTLIPLAGKEIHDCTHCNFCMSKQTSGRFCGLQDDMDPLYAELVRADVIFLATPVYFGRLSGRLANFIDRLRCLYFGNLHKGKLANKVGGALAVSWYRNRGVETALLSIVEAYMGLELLPVGPPMVGSVLGAAGNASDNGTGEFDRTDKHGIHKDKHGLKGARLMAKRAVQVAGLLKSSEKQMTP
jgi:multimeric flavodoxin WrbA